MKGGKEKKEIRQNKRTKGKLSKTFNEGKRIKEKHPSKRSNEGEKGKRIESERVRAVPRKVGYAPH